MPFLGGTRPEPRAQVPAPAVVSARHGDDTVLLNAATGHYYTLNQTGTQIWEWLCEGVAPDSIADRLHTEFGVPVEAVRADLTQFLHECAAASLLHSE